VRAITSPRDILVGTPTFFPTCSELLRVARKRDLDTRVRQNNPTGKSIKSLSSPSRKNIPLNPSGKSVALIRASRGR
jgi:hypothetical protein